VGRGGERMPANARPHNVPRRAPARVLPVRRAGVSKRPAREFLRVRVRSEVGLSALRRPGMSVPAKVWQARETGPTWCSAVLEV